MTKRQGIRIRIWILGIMLALAVSWGGIFPQESHSEIPPSQVRFGVATNRNPLDYAYQDLKMGWYHNWGARPWNMSMYLSGTRLLPIS